MHKIVKIIIIFVVIMLIIPISNIAINEISSYVNKDILNELEGEIYYTKRIDLTLMLFKYNCDLYNEELIYSHKGKGFANQSDYNDNILNFNFDIESKIITFTAMNEGEWSIFTIKEGEEEATLVRNAKESELITTNYIRNLNNTFNIFEREGSLYIRENDTEKLIKRFYGIYDDKFTGYRIKGISPDGKYLIYTSNGALTLIGGILNGTLTSFKKQEYIMDLETYKSTKFFDYHTMQWIENK